MSNPGMAGGRTSSRYQNATFDPPPSPALTVRKHIESRIFTAGGLVHDRPTDTLQLDSASPRRPPVLWPLFIRPVPFPSPMIVRGPRRLKLPRVACHCLTTGIQTCLGGGPDCYRRPAHLSLHRHVRPNPVPPERLPAPSRDHCTSRRCHLSHRAFVSRAVPAPTDG